MTPDPALDLDGARRLAGLSVEQLWYAYIALGGSNSKTFLETGLADERGLSPHEHDLIGHALNERLMDLGEDHPVPYWRPDVATW